MTAYEWWTLGISIVATGLSAAIAVLAIWGDWIRQMLSPPRLRLRLRSEKGELADQGGKKARYYHLEVSNVRIWAPAKDVVVNLLEIDRPGPGVDWKRDYETGPIPLVWQYADYYAGPPDVGRQRYCDLGFIEESQPFVISTQFSPRHLNNVLNAGESMRLHLVAVADNAKSNRIVLELKWDGQWREESEEMAEHLVVKVANSYE